MQTEDNPAVIAFEPNALETSGDGHLRRRQNLSEGEHSSHTPTLEQEYVWLDKAENEMEAQRITNNYMVCFHE